jgi:inositol phosphorylceramide mannosyltransferase catalytic subunit
MVVQVPPIVHQLWCNFAHWGEVQNPPAKYDSARSSWRKHNADWQYLLWNEVDAENILRTEYNFLGAKYDSFTNPIQRVDLLKWVLLHRYGGIVADTDTVCLKSVDLSQFDNAELVLPKWGSAALNAVIAAPPRSAVVMHVLKAFVTTSSTDGGKSVIGVFYSTGPWFVRRALKPLRDRVRTLRHLLRHQKTPREDTLIHHLGAGSWGYKEHLLLDVGRAATAFLLIIALCFLLLVFFRKQIDR